MPETMTEKQYSKAKLQSGENLSADEIAVQSTLNRPNDISSLMSEDQLSVGVYNDLEQHEEYQAQGASGLRFFQFNRKVHANGVELTGKPECDVQGKVIPLINGLSLDLSPAHLKMHADFLNFSNALVESEENKGGDLYAFFPSFGAMLQIPVDRTVVKNDGISATTNNEKLYQMNHGKDKYSLRVNGYTQEGSRENGALRLSDLSATMQLRNDELVLDNIADQFEYKENGFVFSEDTTTYDRSNRNTIPELLHVTKMVDIEKPKITVSRMGQLDFLVTGDFKLNDEFGTAENNPTTEITMIRSGVGEFHIAPFSLPKLNMTLNGFNYEVFEPQSANGEKFKFSRAVLQNKLFRETEIKGGTIDEYGLESDVTVGSENAKRTESEEDVLEATDDKMVKIKFPKYHFESKREGEKTTAQIAGKGYISVEGLKVNIQNSDGTRDTLDIDDLKPDPNDIIDFTADGQGKVSAEIGDLEGDIRGRDWNSIIIKDAEVTDGKFTASEIKIDTNNESESEVDIGDDSPISEKSKSLIETFVPMEAKAGIRRHYTVKDYNDGTIEAAYQRTGIGKIELGVLGGHLGANLDVDEGKYELSISNEHETDEDEGSYSIFDSSKWKSGANADIPLLGPLMLDLSISGSASLSYGLKAGLEVGGTKKGDKIKGMLGGEIGASLEAELEFGLGLGIADIASVYGAFFAKFEVEPSFSVSASTEVELVEDEKNAGKLRPQFTGDVRIDLHGEAEPTISAGISAGVKVLIWKGQLYSVTLTKKKLAALEFNKGIVRQKDGTWEFKDSEFTIEFLGNNVYELSRNNGKGIFETQKEELYYNLADKDGNSLENALEFLQDMRAFRKDNETMYDREEFGLAMRDGIAVRKKFVTATEELEAQLTRKEEDYQKMMANNAVLQLSHYGDMVRHEDNMRIISEALNGVMFGTEKASDVLAEIRRQAQFEEYSIYAGKKTRTSLYGDQIATTDMFRTVDEKTEDSQIATEGQPDLLKPGSNESLQEMKYEDLKYFYLRNMMQKGRQGGIMAGYQSNDEYGRISRYRRNDILLHNARIMLMGDAKSYRANVARQFGEDSPQMAQFIRGSRIEEGGWNTDLGTNELNDDETFVASQLARTFVKPEVQKKLNSTIPATEVDQKKRTKQRVAYSNTLTQSLESRDLYEQIKGRFKEAIGSDNKGNMTMDIISRYREETRKATAYRKYAMSLDKIAETAYDYNKNLKLQIECCRLIAENAEAVLNSKDLMNQVNDASVTIALNKSKEFKQIFGTKPIEEVAKEAQKKCRALIALYDKRLSMFRESEKEIQGIELLEGKKK